MWFGFFVLKVLGSKINRAGLVSGCAQSGGEGRWT